MLEFDCAKCGNHFRVSEELAGKAGKCALCGNTFPFPGSPIDLRENKNIEVEKTEVDDADNTDSSKLDRWLGTVRVWFADWNDTKLVICISASAASFLLLAIFGIAIYKRREVILDAIATAIWWGVVILGIGFFSWIAAYLHGRSLAKSKRLQEQPGTDAKTIGDERHGT